MKKSLAALASLLLAGIAYSAPVADSILHVKSGDVKLTLLDSDGVRPLRDIGITFQDTRTEGNLVKATTDRSGTCQASLMDGTYGLGIDGKVIALIEASPTSETVHLRLVTPRRPLVVGGAEGAVLPGAENSDQDEEGILAWVGNNPLKTALIVGGAVATGIIMEEENDGPSRPPSADISPTTDTDKPSPRRRSSQSKPKPDIDRPVSR